jgi:3'(2'),5'-bisphosphate nucleotidase
MSGSDATIETLIDLALHAGRVILDYHRDGVAHSVKQDQSPVTAADAAAEEIILAGLAAAFPKIPVVAEEAAAAGHIPAVGATFFLVDPLDGTREFVGGGGEFTVNIALVRGGAPIAGVVYAPAASRLYAAADGRAFRSAVARDFTLVGREPLRARPVPERRLIAVASRSHRSPDTDEFLKTLDIGEFAAAGSSLKFCLIAEGSADVYPRLGRTMEWDTAAGQAVLEAAGGRVLLFPDGPPLSYGKAERGFDNPHFIAWGAK